MRKREASNEKSIRDLLGYLNACHDGSICRISFLKKRNFSENGDLVYPYTKLEDLIKCDIEVELLLNSYNGALPKQVVVLHFEGVKSFHFFQEHTFDYSEIYEVTFCVLEVNKFEFIFHVRPGSIFHVRPGSELIDTLKIVCTKMICKEL